MIKPKKDARKLRIAKPPYLVQRKYISEAQVISSLELQGCFFFPIRSLAHLNLVQDKCWGGAELPGAWGTARSASQRRPLPDAPPQPLWGRAVLGSRGGFRESAQI